jgi:hypothetical protein
MLPMHVVSTRNIRKWYEEPGKIFLEILVSFFLVLSSLARYARDLLTALYHFSSYRTHLTSTKKTVPLILGSPFPPPPPPLRPSRPRLRLRLCLCLRPRLRLSLRLPTFALASCTPNRLGTRILHVIQASESILGGNRQEIASLQ